MPSPYLTEPSYWQQRLEKLQGVRPGLIVLPRPDLSDPVGEVMEWRLRAHDGVRLRGLRAVSRFHPEPKGAYVRVVNTQELLEIDRSILCEGCADLVLCLPPERRLEDRVLDLLRVFQLALASCELEPDQVEFQSPDPRTPDELLIARGLLAQGMVPAI